jgi:post-segregation antitoxin (ccd killing protein)
VVSAGESTDTGLLQENPSMKKQNGEEPEMEGTLTLGVRVPRELAKRLKNLCWHLRVPMSDLLLAGLEREVRLAEKQWNEGKPFSDPVRRVRPGRGK